jgi:hypothetical protein
MKKIAILSLFALVAIACSKDNSANNGTVTLKASSAFGTAAKSAFSARAVATVTLTDFKVNIGRIKFETDEQDERHNSSDSEFEDVKLTGPFLLDLLDQNQNLSQIIASLNIPNGRYEEIKFKFRQSTIAGEMNGKTFLIKGTVGTKQLLIWSDKELEVNVDFEGHNRDLVINGDNISLNIKLRLDALIAKINDLASQNLLLDGNGDGVIEISTSNVDGNQEIGNIIKDLIHREEHLEDRD